MSPYRALMLWVAAQTAVGAWLERLPVADRLVARFVAGRTVESALAAAQPLLAQGYRLTFSYLGEDVRSADEAQAAVEEYSRLIAAIGAAAMGSSTKIAVKPSLIGLQVDPENAERHLAGLVIEAAAHGIGVELDMERSGAVSATLTLYRAVRAQHATLGVALQAYLRRSDADLEALLRDRIANVRLVKGAYAEPAAVAFPSRRQIDRAFHRLLRAALAPEALGQGGTVAVATHDTQIIASARTIADRRRGGADQWEIQMLYGVRREVQQRLLREHYPLRIYLPYGERWYPYFVRRLAERPANLWFALQQILFP